jgi:hypothetical protein
MHSLAKMFGGESFPENPDIKLKNSEIERLTIQNIELTEERDGAVNHVASLRKILVKVVRERDTLKTELVTQCEYNNELLTTIEKARKELEMISPVSSKVRPLFDHVENALEILNK